jgi:hypothetical protein
VVPPVVGNSVIDAKLVLVVAYAQVAFSLVVTEREAFVVPAGSVPLGAAFEIVGGVVSGGTGGGTTATVTLCVMEPPAPVQVSEYVALVVTLVNCCVPLVDCEPLQLPLAVQLVVFAELQVTVSLAPETIDGVFAESVRVGAGGWLPLPFPLLPPPLLPPAPPPLFNGV